jgi:SAM-dependent methyltransferase
MDKSSWIFSRLRCPLCQGEAFQRSALAAKCEQCGTEYPITDHLFNMLDPATRSQFGIVSTDHVSSNNPVYSGELARLIQEAEARGGKVLDCGSGYVKRSYANVVQMEVVPYPHVDVLATNQRIPFRDGSFDVVFSMAVLEHVDNPFLCARELARVLKPGGLLYVDVPFLQPEHGYPHHYFNMTRMGLLKLFAGLLEVEKHFVPDHGHPMYSLVWFLDTYANSLPVELRETFGKMRIDDLRAKSATELTQSPLGTNLSQAGKWILASTTCANMRKPQAGAGTEPSRSSGEEEIPANLTPVAEQASADAELLRQEIAGLRDSFSWRVTAPLRALSNRFIPHSVRFAVKRRLRDRAG